MCRKISNYLTIIFLLVLVFYCTNESLIKSSINQAHAAIKCLDGDCPSTSPTATATATATPTPTPTPWCHNVGTEENPDCVLENGPCPKADDGSDQICDFNCTTLQCECMKQSCNCSSSSELSAQILKNKKMLKEITADLAIARGKVKGKKKTKYIKVTNKDQDGIDFQINVVNPKTGVKENVSILYRIDCGCSMDSTCNPQCGAQGCSYCAPNPMPPPARKCVRCNKQPNTICAKTVANCSGEVRGTNASCSEGCTLNQFCKFTAGANLNRCGTRQEQAGDCNKCECSDCPIACPAGSGCKICNKQVNPARCDWAPGANCVADADCGAGFKCKSCRCRRLCANDNDCKANAGQPCSVNSTCDIANQVCNDDGNPPTCGGTCPGAFFCRSVTGNPCIGPTNCACFECNGANGGVDNTCVNKNGAGSVCCVGTCCQQGEKCNQQGTNSFQCSP